MASDELTKLFEELHSNFNQDDNEEKSENDASSSEEVEVDLSGMNDEQIIEESKKVSIFCRNCLSPYKSERGKGGSIILKCEKCNHRDVVKENDLEDTEPERSVSLATGGNLILNRFKRILLEKNELRGINLEDPALIDDDFKTISEVLPKITTIMKQTFSDMHIVTDDHRKVHNQEMIEMLTQQGEGEECEAEDGSKSLRFTVPIYGSEETGDLVILPEKYKLPQETVDKFRMVGRNGVQRVDKLILLCGFSIEQIEKMPQFQHRLLSYCKFVQSLKCKYDQQNGLEMQDQEINTTNHTHSEMFESKRENIDPDEPCERFNTITCNEKDASDESCDAVEKDVGANSSPKDIPSDYPTQGNHTETSTISVESSVVEENVIDKNDNDSLKISEDQQCVFKPSETEFISESDDQVTSCISDSEVDIEKNVGNCTTTVDTLSELESDEKVEGASDGGCRSKELETPEETSGGCITPELIPFLNMFNSSEEQKKLSLSIPEDVVICKDSNPVMHLEANDNFNELTSAMTTRVTEAKAQRMRNTLAFIKRAGQTMTDEVDRVQGEMIKELQIAYKSKKIKANKQKKQLEETQSTLEYYSDLIAHYQQTGEVDKLMEIYDLLQDYESLN